MKMTLKFPHLDDDEYQPAIKRRRKHQNQRSMCFIIIGALESMFSKYVRECYQGTLDIDIAQYDKLITHLILI